MKGIVLYVVCEVIIVTFLVGCWNAADDLNEVAFSKNVKIILQDVSNGKIDAKEHGMNLMRSIVEDPQCNLQKMKRRALFDAVANVTFSGEKSIEREYEYHRLHDFLKGASNILMEHGNEWGTILELWFAEVECHKKESDICDKAAKRLMESSKQAVDFETAMMIARKADEMRHCSQYSASYHESDMSLIVLWDDSVAARYCATLPWWRKKLVVWRIKKVIGRYPDWYLEEKKKGAK